MAPGEQGAAAKACPPSHNGTDSFEVSLRKCSELVLLLGHFKQLMCSIKG